MKRKIGIDFDDVIFDFNRSYVEHHNKVYGTDMTRDRITDYMMEKVWNIPIEEIMPRIDKFCFSDDHFEVLPVEGSVKAIKELSKNNELIIITSRPDSKKDITLKWLEKNFNGFIGEVCFTNSFGGDVNKKRKKSSVCKELGIDIFIEDAPIYAKDVSDSGIPVLLIDAPWNKNVSGDLIKRVHSWDEIYSLLSK